LLRGLQHDLGDMYPTPIVSMSADQVERRERWHARQALDAARISRQPPAPAAGHVPAAARAVEHEEPQHGR
jgi:hypothetical protein